jgi:hypothetical protein
MDTHAERQDFYVVARAQSHLGSSHIPSSYREGEEANDVEHWRFRRNKETTAILSMKKPVRHLSPNTRMALSQRNSFFTWSLSSRASRSFRHMAAVIMG